MPFVTVRMLEGRTHEQKKQLVKAVTEALAETCDANPDSTMVVVEDIPRDHWARGGKFLSEH